MPKPKKSDLRYGDVIRFKETLTFQSQNSWQGNTPGFEEQEFRVDILPPKRGKKTPEYELRPNSNPDRICTIKTWPEFEIVSRLPENVIILKSRHKNFGNIFIKVKNIVLMPGGQSWDEQALIAKHAREEAERLGCAAIIFRSFGYCEIWPWPEGVPSLEFLQEQTSDPYQQITALDTNRLPAHQYLAYGGDNALDLPRPVLNDGAQYFLLNQPELHEKPDELEEARVVGDVVILAGFRLDQHGETVRAPLTLAQAAD